ncbi:hypothetical protein VDGD_21188 [Verticillium dahliae]|nr:hypothetical protein VDGD_21188 [Verticillium dahliae]
MAINSFLCQTLHIPQHLRYRFLCVNVLPSLKPVKVIVDMVVHDVSGLVNQ